MRVRKQLGALALILAICLTALAGCAQKEEGLALSVSVGDSPLSLDPIYAEQPGDQSILVQLYENLMRETTDGEGKTVVTGGMAKSVDQEQRRDGTVVYTFRLRNAKWSDGKDVVAADFVYAWQRLVNPASQSPYASLLSVVDGYQEARSSGDLDLLQVKAKNATTLEVTLDGRYDWFLTEVCTSPATMPLRRDVVQKLKEENQQGEEYAPWWSDPTKLVTNGPCVVESWKPTEYLKATASPRYESKQAGPESITFRFAPTAEKAWELYEREELDAVWPLPEAQLQELSEDEEWQATPELSTHSVLMNYRQEQLADPLVRQAMALVIDRMELSAIAGSTTIPAEGLVPPGVPGTDEQDFRTEGGALLDNDPETYQERCEQARALLMESGHLDGRTLGTLTYFYVDRDHNREVAEAICRMWKDELGITVIPTGMKELELWGAMRSGEFQLACVELVAPGNDAECFLMDWTSDSHDNLVGYENSAYDTLMNIIATAASEIARMGCLHDAEVLLLSDDVVVPLYTDGTAWMLREGLTGLHQDARGFFSFAGVFQPTA